MGWKCVKLLKMGQIYRNGSHLYKQATFKKVVGLIKMG